MNCVQTGTSNDYQSLVNDYFRLFVNRTDAVLVWRGGWRIDRRTLTPRMIERALNEPLPLGLMAVSGADKSRWTCWDSDDDHSLSKLITLYDDLPPGTRLFETSRRGAHVWYFHDPVSWQSARQFGNVRAKAIGLSDIEVFPKHGGLNAVRLPGMVHPKSGERHPLIDPHSGEILELAETLACMCRSSLADDVVERWPSLQASTHVATTDFELIQELSAITEIKEYAPGRATGICPWHDDTHASLYVKGRRFHCLACGAWGDVWDVRRWRIYGNPLPKTARRHSGKNA